MTTPTQLPSGAPSMLLIVNPTLRPTIPFLLHVPTAEPSSWPSLAPVPSPTGSPSPFPSRKPSGAPTLLPNLSPTAGPTRRPSQHPTLHHRPAASDDDDSGSSLQFGASAAALSLIAAGGLLLVALAAFAVYRARLAGERRRRYASMTQGDEQRTNGFKNRLMAAPDSFLSVDPASIAMGQQATSPLSESFVKGNQEDWL